MDKILIIEDEKKLRDELKIYLENSNYEVITIESFDNVLNQMISIECDLILLDLSLPNVSGEQLCLDYRHQKDTPIIILTSKNDEMVELLTIKYGADDFIAKPYNPLILVARIENLLKRVNKNTTTINYQEMTVNVSRSVITKDNKDIELSKNEMRILYYLLTNKGKIVSRNKIMDYLWDSDMFVDDNTLTVNINRLRNKLADLGYPDIIITKRSQGYIIE
ncbi:MAG: response regulator transcription factor [Thomasclavelia sp.]|nr:response regulator transcription factor [Thomasclavelia sp.]